MAPFEQDPPYVKPLHLLQQSLCRLSRHYSSSSTLREYSQEAYHWSNAVRVDVQTFCIRWALTRLFATYRREQTLAGVWTIPNHHLDMLVFLFVKEGEQSIRRFIWIVHCVDIAKCSPNCMRAILLKASLLRYAFFKPTAEHVVEISATSSQNY